MEREESENGERRFTREEILTAQDSLTAVRAIGDLLTAAADSIGRGRSEFHKMTLEALGMHLENLATEALVALHYEAAPGKEREASDAD